MPLIVRNPADLRPRTRLQDYLLWGFICFCSIVLYHIYTKLTHPYIDEIFHIRQCQAYCHSKFSQWDSKITTPPGLYILGTIYAKVLLILSGGKDLCQNLTVLRSLNLLGGIAVMPKVLEMFQVFDQYQFWTVNILSQPLLFSYYFLFYTDIWSTILIIASLGLVMRIPLPTLVCFLSGLLGFISLWFRQTNIVWIAFILSVMIDRRVIVERGEMITYLKRLYRFSYQLVYDYIKTIPYLINFILFLIFLKINGGITLGDKSNHEITFHLVQVFYCFVFILFFTWPVWLKWQTIIDYKNFLIGNFFKIIFNILAFAAIWFIIDRFTIVHIFLLSDNRHYTFYIYRRLLLNKYSPFVAVPLYHFATWVIISTLLKSKRLALSPITITTFLGATCLTLIPSPLFEPRYFIIPLIIFRIMIKPVDKSRSLIEFVWLNLINVLTTLIFFNYEFKWDSEGDIIQRIYW